MSFERLLNVREVMAKTGYSRTTIYRRVRLGDFPAPIRIGPNAIRWRESALAAWLEKCPQAVGEHAIAAQK